ncbi:MAG: aryl-sulfate sulfotransferase [Candidatus Helarchaeota archaeon]
MKKLYAFLLISMAIIATCATIFILQFMKEVPYLSVTIYDPTRACNGTTLIPDNNPDRPRIIEVDMEGNIIWEYILPDDLKNYTNPGFDVEYLPNTDHILFVCPLKGIYEIDRNGTLVWSYNDCKISHDADRLPNGNTLFVWGGCDEMSDAQVREVNKSGFVVWSWHAKDYYNISPYHTISCQGWTHTNAVTRLSNNLTLISLRNFNFLVLVNEIGDVIKEIGKNVIYYPHDPEVLKNGNILVASQRTLISCDPMIPNTSMEYTPVLEINSSTDAIVWEYNATDWYDIQLTRDCNRLPNNNTLIVGTTKIIEVTPSGEIVWQLELNTRIYQGESASRGFYKAERIASC